MLDIINLTASYNKSSCNVLEDINLALPKKSLTAILGANGMGKSSLFKAICGSLFINQGQIKIDGIDVASIKASNRSNYINSVNQNPLEYMCENLTIAENSVLYLKKHLTKWLSLSLNSKVKKKIQDHFINLELNYSDCLDKPLSCFSGGQRQAISLAIATIYPGKVLLLDEPTSALDYKLSYKTMMITKKIITKFNLVGLMITHNLNEALLYSDNILVIKNGKITYFGSNSSDLNNEKLVSLL